MELLMNEYPVYPEPESPEDDRPRNPFAPV